MIWVTRRQHRGELIAAGVVAVALAVFVVVSGHIMSSYFDQNSVGDCLGSSPGATCNGVVGDFTSRFSVLVGLSGFLTLLPLLAGMFVGAPLLARELERGTHRLAWTQGVTRQRWLAVKLALVMGAGVVAAVALTLTMTWWRGLFDEVGARLENLGFDFEGTVEIGYFVFALALGVLVGALLRRTLPAMAVTLVAFLAVRIPVELILRPRYMAPLTITTPPTAGAPSLPAGAWRIDNLLIDGAGNSLSRRDVFNLCGGGVRGGDGGGSLRIDTACLQSHGIMRQLVYQPADRFWTFQLIETGIFVALGVACLALTVWWVRHRLR